MYERRGGFSAPSKGSSLAILSWNCQGLGNVLTIRRLKEIYRSMSPDVMFLMETKNDDAFVNEKLQSLQYSNYFSVPPNGLSGGLSLLWKDSVDITVLDSSLNMIDAKIIHKGVTSFVSFIYGAPQMENRAAFWDKLAQTGLGRDTPWLITGDFNEILDNSEKVGGPPRLEGSFTTFRSFVAQNGLWDLKHSGDSLSWRGNRHSHFIRSRLDRSMGNCSWAEAFPLGRCCYLRFEGSDHRPVMTYFNSNRHRHRGMFRFNRTLTEKEEITQIVESAWNHSPLDSVILKLNACRRGIIKWAKEQQQKSNLLISQHQTALDAALSDPIPDQNLIDSIQLKLRCAYLEEELFWRQRSRIQWLKEGDRNTGFFHAATRIRRTINSIPVLEDGQGNVVYEEHDISRVISEYFQNIFTSNGNEDFSLIRGLLSRKVTPEMNQKLTTIPSNSEIKEAVLSINGNKAPGPDGFSATFYQSYWHIVGEDVQKDIRSFFTSSSLDAQQNETHIRLIPKTTGPRAVSDYRPIALCNTHYKIIAKILTRRLKPLLPSLISNTQSAFVTGRAISDNVLITHETLHYLRTSEAKKYCSMAVKTDMSKAYDRIEWSFVREVLTLLGFDPQWVSWIMACIESVSYTFLINGTPQGLVKPSRGLRQGDPLSPHIFILCTEVLSALCERGQNDGSMPGIRVARGCPAINHLLFADDTMFFCKSKASCVTALMKILEIYETVSGQRINPLKSAITFSARTPPEVRARVKETMAIESEGGIGKYLGLPEHFGRKKRDIFAAIVDKIRQKSHSWSTRFLSGAGKQILLKSVLAAMPCYTMSCFKLPASLCKQIQSLFTRFWWDSNPEKRKMCWVAWTSMALPKYAGGLGFRDIETFNDALLAKIGWRLIKEPQSLLARVLLGKYARDTGFLDCTTSTTASHGWRSVLAGREILKKGLSWVVGNGESILVWGDAWLSFKSPRKPIGPANSQTQFLKVSELLCPLTNTWEVDKIRCHIPLYEEAILKIKTSSVPANDSMVWLPEKSGVYSTKTGYGLGMCDKWKINETEPSFNWLKNIWNVETSPKLKDFLWKLVREAIPVSANLERRGIQAFGCKHCGAPESDRHVFLTCPMAINVWSLIPIQVIPSTNLSSMAELLTGTHGMTPLPPTGLTSPLWPWVLWNLWKARNARCYENKIFSAQEVALKSIKDAKEWSLAQSKPHTPFILETGSPHAHHLARSPCPPPTFPPGTLVCKVDAAWDANTGACGIGGIFTGSNTRRFPNLCETSAHVSSALMAEAIAVRLAVATAVYSNVRSLAVLSDSLSLIKLLKSGGSQPELFGIMFDIYHYLSLFDVISFHFISRNFNGEADAVAKSAISMIVSNSREGE
ncbi:hypothetical protein Bca101_008448 [Brassica carinata]